MTFAYFRNNTPYRVLLPDHTYQPPLVFTKALFAGKAGICHLLLENIAGKTELSSLYCHYGNKDYNIFK